MSEMNASGQPEESYSYAELSPAQNVVDELPKSTYLWTSLRRLHEDMNAKSRCGSCTPDTRRSAQSGTALLHDRNVGQKSVHAVLELAGYGPGFANLFSGWRQ